VFKVAVVLLIGCDLLYDVLWYVRAVVCLATLLLQTGSVI